MLVSRPESFQHTHRGVLPESNQVQTIDDLPALQIEVVDGGDGMLDKDDYFLFKCKSSEFRIDS